MTNGSNEEKRYDYIVVGAGAAGSVLAAELSASGDQVLVIESGGPDDAPTIMNPSIWFYNVGGPLMLHFDDSFKRRYSDPPIQRPGAGRWLLRTRFPGFVRQLHG